MFNFREIFRKLFGPKEPAPAPKPPPPVEPPTPEPAGDLVIAAISNLSVYDKIITVRYLLGDAVYSENVLMGPWKNLCIRREEVEKALITKDIDGFKLKVYSDMNTDVMFLNGYTAQPRPLTKVSDVIDDYIPGNPAKVSLYYQQKAYPQYYQFTNNPTCAYIKKDFYYILEFVLMTIYHEFAYRQPNVLGIGDLGPKYPNAVCRGHGGNHSGSSNHMDLHYFTNNGNNITQANYAHVPPTDIYTNNGRYLDTTMYDWERNFMLWGRLLGFFKYGAMVDSRIENYTFSEARKKYGQGAVSAYLNAVIVGDTQPYRYNHDTHGHFALGMTPRHDYMENGCMYENNKLMEYTVTGGLL